MDAACHESERLAGTEAAVGVTKMGWVLSFLALLSGGA
jgi:hypothetical protein